MGDRADHEGRDQRSAGCGKRQPLPGETRGEAEQRSHYPASGSAAGKACRTPSKRHERDDRADHRDRRSDEPD